MKNLYSTLSVLLLLTVTVWAQPATVSYPFAVGRTSTCGSSGSADIHYYTYDGITNTIANASGGLVNACVPQLRIGGTPGSTQRFTSSLASVSFNPKDHKIYYLWTALSGTLAPGGPRTYAWSWPVGTCPGTSSNKLDTIRSFKADILGVAFDNNGKGYMLEFTNALPTSPPTYKPLLRSIDFATGAMGGVDTLQMTGGAKIYATGSGDVAMSPSGQMFFVVNNKLFTPNYNSYTGTGSSITCTYLDTVTSSNYFVGLTYAEGETIAAYSGGTCPFQEIVPLTGITSTITKNTSATVKSASDLATIISGIGAAKKLVSVNPTGTPNQYNVVYDIFVHNYGNMDVTNVQVQDNLGLINGNGNVSNVSATFTSNPNGYTINPSYNGTTNINLLSGTPTLPNYPVANSSFTIRITCRLSNIMNGVVYNNSAVVTARDFNSNNLRDSSTNGTVPDLNLNDKPDDIGESQPTPLLVSVTAYEPPCQVLGNVLYRQTFGAGTGLTTSIPIPSLPAGKLGPGKVDYAGTTSAPLGVDRYTLSNNAVNGHANYWISLSDHTGDANGRMLLVNADANNTIFYRDTIVPLCANQQYSLFFYAAFLGNSNYQTVCDGFGGFRYPKITMKIRDQSSGLVITQLSTPDITSNAWNHYGLKFVLPPGFSNIVFELMNEGGGGCGNDIAIDDIQFGICDAGPLVSVNAVAGCLGDVSTFTSSLSDVSALPGTADYQWQVATNIAGPWSNISGQTGPSYVINPLAASDTGKFYRVMVAAEGNMAIAACRYLSGGHKLTGKIPSVAATSASKNKDNICAGIGVTLNLTGGTLGTNATWRWYSGSCAGTLVGTGSSLSVMPSSTTSYYVRAEGDCNSTICRPVNVNILCNIDKDKDGIPDYVESYMPAALQDADGDGISNAFDLDYAGFVDYNNDHINDNFQADGDSDNDGIPNYLDTNFPGRVDSNGDGVDDRFDHDLDGIINMLDLDSDNDGIPDVVEANGVDMGGDGAIDNYTDTDNDGLSQNVDGNNTGARISGVGLGVIDLDGDGYPNTIDLDSDNDGIPDIIEVLGPDTNNDGKPDAFVDANGDGIHDGFVNANALLRTGADTNSDGRADSYPEKNFDNDKRPNPYDVDSDNDGIADVLEAGFTDANFNGFVDGAIGTNGWSTVVDALPVLNLPNTDGTGLPDYLDIDSDDDGIPDNVEGMTTIGYVMPTWLDNDSDGLDNAYDNAPAVFGGRGVFLSDKDLDGIPDYRDLDTDSDGVPDIIEGNDFNLNGLSDDIVTLTGLDTDGDGLDNRFDSLTSTTNRKGTSYRMGTGGSFSGDATPGSRATVQRTNPMDVDRDWRSVGYVLYVNRLKLTAGLFSNNSANLEWDIQSPVDIATFEIERSTDNTSYTRIAVLHDAVEANAVRNFVLQDDISVIDRELIYYRVKVIAANGRAQYSNVAAVKKTLGIVAPEIYPNPAEDDFVIRFVSKEKTSAVVKILDKLGRTIMVSQRQVAKGRNDLTFNCEKLSAGVYVVHVIMPEEEFTLRLIVK